MLRKGDREGGRENGDHEGLQSLQGSGLGTREAGPVQGTGQAGSKNQWQEQHGTILSLFVEQWEGGREGSRQGKGEGERGKGGAGQVGLHLLSSWGSFVKSLPKFLVWLLQEYKGEKMKNLGPNSTHSLFI